MSILTAAQLRKMAKGKPNASNLNSLLVSINTFGKAAGLDNRVNLSQFLPQVLHESGSLQYDRELWGPTKAQKGYEGRKDLGNTQKGDGSKFRGFGPIQLTGRGNVTRFYKYALKLSSALGIAPPPDFTKDPSKICTDPWEGLSAIWYWDEGNPTGKSLNRLAQDNNIITITRKINGGLNGFDDRLDYYGRVALVLLGYGVSKAEIKRFQANNKLVVDGDIGDKTRMALHAALSGLNPFKEEVVVEVPKIEPVIVDDANKDWLKTVEGNKEVITTIGLPALLGLGGFPWQTILAVGGVLLAGAALVYFVRRSKAKKQRAMVAQIAELNAT